jgi:hypothetical protein
MSPASEAFVKTLVVLASLTVKRVLLWGSGAGLTAITPHGLAYDASANRWSSLPAAPLQGSGQTVAWTGRELIAWGGVIGTPPGTHTPPSYSTEGAVFTPAPERSVR